MLEKCTRLWRKAHLEVKMWKNCSLRSTFLRAVCEWRAVCKWVLQSLLWSVLSRTCSSTNVLFRVIIAMVVLSTTCPSTCLFICCCILSLHWVIASGCVNGCAYVSSRFLWVTCVSLLISSAYVSVSILCVSSDRRCSRKWIRMISLYIYVASNVQWCSGG